MSQTETVSVNILGMRVDATSYIEATRLIANWAAAGESKYVCVANVHMTMECFDDPTFRDVVNEAHLVTADGMPLVWGLRLLGVRSQRRVYGPDLTLHVCSEAAQRNIPIALYGGTAESLSDFSRSLHTWYPGLRIVCQIAPPFRPLTAAEDAEYTRMLVHSGARITLVGIGCPKQERWMAEHCGRIPGAMIGVGAAFDFHSGRIKQAPAWMQSAGLEWLFRLVVEPRRLWKRYLKHNPRFAALLVLQLLGASRFVQPNTSRRRP